jgi:ketosteroid isomerase-like protein
VATIGRPPADASAAAAAADAAREPAAVATLHRLNGDWLRSFLNRDAAWYSEHLADDFICVLADGRRINKHEFLRHLREQPRAETVGCDEVDVHLLDAAGAVALVRGVIHVRGPALTLLRYTMLWQATPGRWQAVAAQFTPLETEPHERARTDDHLASRAAGLVKRTPTRTTHSLAGHLLLTALRRIRGFRVKEAFASRREDCSPPRSQDAR